MATNNEWEKYWRKGEVNELGQIVFWGSHSTRTDSLNNLPLDKDIKTGSMCITVDGIALIYDDVLDEWIQQ